MRYHERLKNIWKACSGEESRYAINSALLDVDKKAIVATDGHMLVALDVADLLEPEDKKFLIPVDAFKAAQALYMAQKRREKKVRLAVFIRATEDAVTVTVGNTKRTQSFDKETRTYPQWETVAVSTDGYKGEITLSVSLLTALTLAMRGCYKGEDAVTILVKDQQSPVVISVNGDTEKSYGILMPMRSEQKKPTRFWLSEK